MSSEPNLKFNAPKAGMWLVWLGLTQSVVLYYFVLKFAVPASGESPQLTPPNLKNILLIAGAVILLVSFVIRFGFTMRKPAFAVPSYIISLAFAEIPAIFGLVLGLQGVDMAELYPFFGMGLLGLLAQPPTVIPKSKAAQLV